ncbi:MAG: Ig-like domain-containing protein, partial [Myxococcota bacterium]|nr:Ig-like domain-containing protein [Myxococcota bacterium]
MKKLLGFLLVAGLTACAPTVEIDDTDSQDTVAIVEFDPANSIVPFPNNLLLDPTTGILNIPAGCFETEGETTLRANLLNQLDGFALVDTPIATTFSEAVDLESVADKVMVMNMADGSTVDVLPVGLTTSRWDATCSTFSTDIPQMALIPTSTLKPNTNYAVILKNGITSVNGNTFKASAVWGLT